MWNPGADIHDLNKMVSLLNTLIVGEASSLAHAWGQVFSGAAPVITVCHMECEVRRIPDDSPRSLINYCSLIFISQGMKKEAAYRKVAK